MGDCAAVLPGFSIKTRVEHETDGTHQVLMAKHLKEGEPYRYSHEDELRIKPKTPADKYLVRNGDIVFISRGLRNSAFLIGTAPEPTLASSTLYIIRPYPGIDPGYLAWCINQPPAQAAILQARTGAGTPIVQRNEFTGIAIPVPSLDKQRQIAGLSDLMARERALRHRLLDETERYHQLLGQQILMGI